MPLARLTNRTVTDPARVRQEWALIRQRGYAVNEGETIVGAYFSAAPVLDANRQVCASLSVGVPQPRYSPELGDRLAHHLVDCCQKLSSMLKATGYVHEQAFAPETR